MKTFAYWFEYFQSRDIRDGVYSIGEEAWDAAMEESKQAISAKDQPSEPGKVKSLAQYLAEYFDHEQTSNEENCGFIPGIDVDFQSQSISVCTWELEAMLKQALDAYESTEQVKIRIERV